MKSFDSIEAQIATHHLIMKLSMLLFPVVATLLASCASLPPPTTVASVDLSRYAGDWYEIESFPNWFQRGCSGTKANYTPQPDGKIRVINTCERANKQETIEGTARVVPGSNNSKLKVSFFWPFEGDYWILDLDPDYRWAAVGAPDRNYLWILARDHDLAPNILEGIRNRLAAKGYDISRLRSTPSPVKNQASR